MDDLAVGSFGALLREWRLRSGLSQEALAHRAALSVRGVRNLEAGASRPRASSLVLLAGALTLTEEERERLESAGREQVEGERPAARAASPGAGGRLPAELTRFIGRDAESVALRDLLGQERLVTVSGPGGVGKSRLMRHVAGPDGGAGRQWLVELADLREADLLPSAVAAAVGLREASGRPVGDQLADHLGGGPALLLLDNCEHLVEPCAELVAALLAGCPGLRVLATSREALSVPGERLLPLAPLPPADAARLFADRAAAVRPGFALTDATTAAVTEVCRRVGGLPLAIELAAARLAVLSVDDLLSRLDQQLDVLAGTRRGDSARHGSVRDMVEWSYRLLDDAERAAFTRASCFVGGFTAAAHAAVCGGGLDVLAGLVGKSLLLGVPHGAGMRYELLEPVRQYAAEQLRAAGGRCSASRAHAAYYTDLAERGHAHRLGPGRADWLDRLHADADNLRAALRWSAEAEPDLARRLFVAWGWLLNSRPSEGAHWWRVVQPLVAAAATGDRLRLLYMGGQIAFQCRDFAAAADRYRAALALVPAAGQPAPAVPLLAMIGMTVSCQGRLPEALELNGRALALARELADESAVAQCLRLRAFLQLRSGQLAEADATAREALRLAAAIGEPLAGEQSRLQLAEVAIAAGRFADAATLLAGARERLAPVADAEDLSRLDLALGRIALHDGRLDEAGQHLHAALARCDDVGDRWWAASARKALEEYELRRELPGTAGSSASPRA